MEESWRVPDDGAGLADALTRAHAELLVREARELVLVAAWCDAHDEATVAGAGSGRVLAGTERARCYGGHGTPAVAEFAAAELAVLLGRSCAAAVNLVRDGLDLRERHPRLWAQISATAHADAATVAAGRLRGVPVWQARKVAAACHGAGLSRAQARWVDAVTTPYLPTMSWGAFLDLLQARIIEADPAAAEQRRTAEEMRRFVATGQCNAHGLKTLIVKARAGDVICLVALIDRIARILALEGDTDPLDVRRATAIGILANPYRTLALLQKHSTPSSGAPDADHDTDTSDAADTADLATTGTAAAGGTAASGTDPTPGQGLLDLFGDRRLHPDEPQATPPPDPDPPPEPVAGPERLDDPRVLRPGDLHPAADDSEDRAECPDPPSPSSTGAAGRCPACGHAPAPGEPAARGVDSALHRTPPPDLARLLPKATLVVHVSHTALSGHGPAAARVEGVGPVTVPQAVAFLGHHRVSVKPVIDLADQTPVDCYEIPHRLREAALLAHPRSIFPFSGATRGLDLDHVTPYRPAHHPQPSEDPRSGAAAVAQTRLDNLAPLGRFEHRVKTHAPGWALHQPRPGVYLWRTRHGYWFRVDHHGTHRLGKHPDLTLHTTEDPAPTPETAAASGLTSPAEKAFARLIRN